MADTKRPPRPSPPITLTRDNAIANLKQMMPPPGYGEGQTIPASGAGGGNAQLLNTKTPATLLDRNNAARPPAPPPFVAGTAAPAPMNVAGTFNSSQNNPGFSSGPNSDPVLTRPGAFLTGQQYNAIPPSVPAPVRTYMGNNPTTDMQKGGPVKKPAWRKWSW